MFFAPAARQEDPGTIAKFEDMVQSAVRQRPEQLWQASEELPGSNGKHPCHVTLSCNGRSAGCWRHYALLDLGQEVRTTNAQITAEEFEAVMKKRSPSFSLEQLKHWISEAEQWLTLKKRHFAELVINGQG